LELGAYEHLTHTIKQVKKVFITVYCLTLAVFHGVGQQLELLGVEYARYPASDVEDRDTINVSFDEFEVSALAPVSIGDRWTLLAGGTYRHILPTNSVGAFEDNLFFLALRLVASYQLSDNKRLIINALPAISTTDDARSFEGDNFLMQGGVFFNKVVNERFSYTLGILSTSRFGSPIVLPSLGFSHETDQFKLNLALPFLVQAIWDHEKRLSYGIRLAVNGSQYNFNDEFVNGNEVLLANFSRTRFGPELIYKIKESLVVNLFGGTTLNRTYNFSLSSIDDLDFGLQNGPFAAIRLSIIPPMASE
jgi:hypothetical protein